MNEAVIKKDIAELNQVINAAPMGSSSHRTAGGIYQSDATEKLTLEQSMEHLRLQVKYLLFDLEATRRENRYLREMLEQRPRPPKEIDEF